MLGACSQDEAKISGDIPDIVLPNLHGKPVNVSEVKSKIQLLVFWATWCQPCLMEIPSLVTLHEKYKSQNFEVVSINVDDPTGQLVGSIYSNYNMNYEVLFGSDDTMMAFGGVQALPTSFFLSGKGKILEKIEGLLPEAYLEAKIQHYLEKT